MSEGLPDLPDYTAEWPLAAPALTNFQPVSLSELRRLITTSNNKTCGLDPCPTVLLKATLDAHEQTVLDIINGSLSYGVFPQPLNQADVKPIIKKPGLDEQVLSNYRPVSNLPFLSKVLERAVSDRLRAHMDKYDLGEKLQSAYQRHHSTETALARVQHDIAGALDKNRGVMLAMIDLSAAAFDTVDHGKFLTVLQDVYGVRGAAHDWFNS